MRTPEMSVPMKTRKFASFFTYLHEPTIFLSYREAMQIQKYNGKHSIYISPFDN